jgi:hypothetical protein
MRCAAGGVILAWLVLAAACSRACADGGTLRLSAVEGAYRISVFTAPAPFRAGPVDISILVQDRATGEPVPSARANVRLTQAGQPALAVPATFSAATNKLFRSARFDLPDSGLWKIQVQIDGPSGAVALSGDVEAGAAAPEWQELWLWIGWPGAAIALFGIHHVLVRRKLGRRDR